MIKRTRIRSILYILLSLLLAFNLIACGNEKEKQNLPPRDATPLVLEPIASGNKVLRDEKGLVEIDISNTDQGYIIIEYLGTNANPKLRIQKGQEQVYTYSIPAGGFHVLPLSEGNGQYTLTAYEHVSNDSYAQIFSEGISVTLVDDTTPYLYTNQYIRFTKNSNIVLLGQEVVSGVTSDLSAVEAIYEYVTKNITYDTDKAEAILTNQLTEYLPDVDKTVDEGAGICFDYAALMTAMLRSQGIPTKLVIGYAGDAYHAWINVYLEESGWIDGIIQFNGVDWTLMDPTFASSIGDAKELAKYVGDGSKYHDIFRY